MAYVKGKLDTLRVGDYKEIFGPAENTIKAIARWNHPEHRLTYRRCSNDLVEVWKLEKFPVNFEPLSCAEIERITNELSTIKEGHSLNIFTNKAVCVLTKHFGKCWHFEEGNGFIRTTRMTELSDADVFDRIALVLTGGVSARVPAHRYIGHMVRQVAELLGIEYRLTGYTLTPGQGR